MASCFYAMASPFFAMARKREAIPVRHCETRATQTLLITAKPVRVEAIAKWKVCCLLFVGCSCNQLDT
jgi:hypothetical protein